MKYLKSIKEMLDPMGKWNANIPPIEKASGSCEDCEGNGFTIYGKSGIKRKCYSCDGQGFNGEVTKSVNGCEWCEAGGEECPMCSIPESNTCPDCNGGGDIACTNPEIHYDDTFCDICEGEGMIQCFTCNGLGSLN